MKSLRVWLSEHRFQVHGTAFMLMVLAPVPMFLAARNGEADLIWILLGVFVFANLLVLI